MEPILTFAKTLFAETRVVLVLILQYVMCSLIGFCPNDSTASKVGTSFEVYATTFVALNVSQCVDEIVVCDVFCDNIAIALPQCELT